MLLDHGCQSLYSNYTFTTLIDRFTSLRAWRIRLSKKPTYKIRAFNSINKATKVTIIGSGPGCPYGLNPDRVVQNNCFEKTLSVTLYLRLPKSNLSYHAENKLSITNIY